MAEFSQTDGVVLGRYPRAIFHLRSQISAIRFGFVFGAGICTGIGFPRWSELVRRIANDPEVRGQQLLQNMRANVSDMAKTQMLYQHFRGLSLDESGSSLSAKFERATQGRWMRIVQRCLYETVDPSIESIAKSHKYLSLLIPLILKSPMTITYNFDDTVERLAEKANTSGRSCEPIWNSHFQPRQNVSVVYHPNGYLPTNLLDYPSDTIVFSESTFADQLISSMAGYHSSILHHLSKTTCVFVGLSLQDETLRHLLRQSARMNPGHYHYIIKLLRDGEPRNTQVEISQTEANFSVYNLITLYLTEDEIASLARLLNMPEPELVREAEELGVDTKYVFYLTGAIGSGKTTNLLYLGSLITYEEWPEERPPELAKSWTDLDVAETKKVDAWLYKQFSDKNFTLGESTAGIHVVDRTPLDPLAFSKPEKIKAKASEMLESLIPGKSKRKLQEGCVILLRGEPEEMETRVVGRHKQSSAPVIENLQKIYQAVFDDCVVVDTTGASIHDVVKVVSHIIHLKPYKTCDLGARLNAIKVSGLGARE
jgi:hypothetical protein